VISTGTPDPEKFTFHLSPVSFAALLIPRHGAFAVFEKLVVAQLVKEFPASYGVCNSSLFRARRIATHPHIIILEDKF